MTNEWTGGETPQMEGTLIFTGYRRESVEGAEFQALDYTPRPYAAITRAHWEDCAYCGGTPGAGPCLYNHVEACANGDAKRAQRRDQFATVVDCPLLVAEAEVRQGQRCTIPLLFAPPTFLKGGV